MLVKLLNLQLNEDCLSILNQLNQKDNLCEYWLNQVVIHSQRLEYESCRFVYNREAYVRGGQNICSLMATFLVKVYLQ